MAPVPARVRTASETDAEAVSRLSGELGYPASVAEISSRLAALLEDPRQALFVADDGSEVLGWIHVGENAALTHDPQAEILGLVVSRRRRRGGIGKALLAQAERWAGRHGYRRVRLRSRIAREDAHAFYRACGYEIEKTQHSFAKTLPDARA